MILRQRHGALALVLARGRRQQYVQGPLPKQRRKGQPKLNVGLPEVGHH
jgi:hypothetical protein